MPSRKRRLADSAYESWPQGWVNPPSQPSLGLTRRDVNWRQRMKSLLTNDKQPPFFNPWLLPVKFKNLTQRVLYRDVWEHQMFDDDGMLKPYFRSRGYDGNSISCPGSVECLISPALGGRWTYTRVNHFITRLRIWVRRATKKAWLKSLRAPRVTSNPMMISLLGMDETLDYEVN